MQHKITYTDNLIALRRAAGQINGIHNMIEEGRSCTDVIIQLDAAIHALYRVEEKIVVKHLEHCVEAAFMGKSKKEQTEKINEITKVMKNLHKLHSR